MKTAIIAIIIVFFLPEGSLFAVTKHFNINRPKNTKDIQYPNSNADMLGDLGWAVLYSLSGGYSAVHGNVSGAIIGTSNGVKKFLNVVEKYQENLRFEREMDEKSYNGYEPIEKDYDQGYNGYDHSNR
ncbi:MAG: hypothetical protein ACRCSV_04835 [Chlamydiales bacterium]